ncbi:MAG: GTPase ObgE [Fimbriimonadaceae bacterium]|nr:GTPase ObgE [Fimbriimonadaceae bacterium]
MSQFIDEAIVRMVSGTGGSGAVGFHREKHVPRGGPNGADGGRGGDIILEADSHRRTLYEFHLANKYHADNGIHAVGNKRGKDAKDIILKMPVGTVVTDSDSGEVLCDLNIHGMKFVVCKGGRGGHGNQHYTSSVRQVPNFAEKGEPGEARNIKLELKLLADVGLVGLPNAGKSTLLSMVSSAKPKIADYPFTTIVPNLGVVSIADQSFVVADLPGLIEGASEGIGLGHQFLRHAERTKVLIHVVDCYPVDESDPIANYELIEKELAEHGEGLGERPRIIALNKIDILPIEYVNPLLSQLEGTGYQVFPISAAAGLGLQPLLFEVLNILERAEAERPAEVNLVLGNKPDEEEMIVVKTDDGGWEIISKKVARMVAMTELTNRDAVRYLHRRLNRTGMLQKLREAGAQEGDTVYVGNNVFTYTEDA